MATFTITANTTTGFDISGAGAPTSTININIGDVWKAQAAMKINIGDVWKDVF